MNEPSALPPFAAVVVAAGQGLRAGQPIPKQFAHYRGMPVLRHSVLALAEAGASPIVVAIPDGAEEIAASALEGIARARCVIGGSTRQESVRLALEVLASHEPKSVLIHDAARPILPQNVINRLLAALGDHPGAIPVLPVVDSLAVHEAGVMTGSADRESLRRVQTPQAFRFDAILTAHLNWQGEANAGDDAQVAQAAGLSVAMVDGDEALKKLTFAEDFSEGVPAMRIGTGHDVHRLAAGEELWLCGLKIDHEKGLAGHSDADVALHAIVDAMLGALALGDIGDHFPPSDPQWKGADSSIFVEHAVKVARKAGYAPSNVDLTILCEAPKIKPHREKMRARLAELLGLPLDCVSVKATTTERLGFTGREEGIEARAAVMMNKIGSPE